ncbi:PKD domain-containing protein [Segeticoccus rhizosphaerae]|uniref:PKD domain-containing protein n=1 Tax=Segeticoccus rhizosphaerae TaxID=1104777 RepID=UPI0012649F00|nr:PKD domain-containing protein [Segeticoccus rhizosphaerae]
MRKTRLAFLSVLALVAALLGVVAPVAVPAASAATVNDVPGAVPVSGTPAIDDGQVLAITQVGDTAFVGGNFTTISQTPSSTTINQPYIMAFDANTGALRTTFRPQLNGLVQALLPGPTADTVYVGGAFTQVNGRSESRLALLDVNTGEPITSFNGPNMNAGVQALGRRGDRLYVGGYFDQVGGDPAGGLTSVNATTGGVDGFLNVQLTEHHNTSPGGKQEPIGVRDMDLSSDGSRLVVVGNFRKADGLDRDQVVLINTAGTQATVQPDWNTNRYQPLCFSWAFDATVRGVRFAPSGNWFAITATGGHNTGTLCDGVARFETAATGTDIQPTWFSATGGDTLRGIAVTDKVVFVGGHMRWMNNTFGSDYAAQGAVPRPGLAAVDAQNGVPVAWNPGRNPRGAGAFALYAGPDGIYVGSDTEWIGNRDYRRNRIAYFKFDEGKQLASTTSPALPGNVMIGGSQGSTANSNVLYRVNAAGPALQAVDSGPNWAVDDNPQSPYHNSGNNAATYDPVPSVDGTVPASTPRSVFDSERWDGGGDPEMAWNFPVPAGQQVSVRLYFANRCSCTGTAGQRVFNVDIDGQRVLSNFDIVASAGDQTGTMRQFNVTSDGSVDIQFGHVTENPLINGIEIVKAGGGGATPPPPGTLSQVTFDGQTAGTLQPVNAGDLDWSKTRGAFMLGSTLYYADVSGALYQRVWSNGSFGAATKLDPYHDPKWDGVRTGSGDSVYDGVTVAFYGQLSNLTSMFYWNGRIYYTLFGQSTLRYRYFTPDAGIVGPDEFTASTDPMWSDVGGAFRDGNTLYFVKQSTGALWKISLANGTVTGSATKVNDPASGGIDWRGRSVFIGPQAPVNKPPVAAFTSGCTALDCTFDGTGSSDPDGSVASWSWNFGDGTTATGSRPSHSYTSPGSYPVTLTVTDNNGATGRVQKTVQVSAPPNQAPLASFSVDCQGLSCSFDGSGSSDPDGSIASYAWSFGDGGTSTEVKPSHVYAGDGQFTVKLTVTDNGGATGVVSKSVSVSSAPVGAGIAFVAGQSVTVSSRTPSVPVPDGVSAGDVLVLAVDANNTAVDMDAPAGWTAVDTVSIDGMSSKVWWKVADAGDAGSPVQVSLSKWSKSGLQVMAYSGVDASNPVGAFASASDTTRTNSHTAPAVSLSPGDVALRLWSDKSTNTTSWSVPAGQSVRGEAYDDGSGSMSVLAADGGPEAGTTAGAVTATANSRGSQAIMWTVPLREASAGGGNATPLASFSVDCQGLSCSFDGSGSSDPDGSIASYAWSFGDGGTSTEVKPSHVYAGDGQFTVKLTVTDNGGATGVVSKSVSVSSAPVGAGIAFVAGQSVTVSSRTPSVPVPDGVSAGDVLVLAVDANNTAVDMDAPAGWTAVDTVSIDGMSSKVWWKVADAGDAGSPVQVSLSKWSKSGLQVMAYSGVDASNPVGAFASASDTTRTNSHTAPAVSLSPGDVALRLWSDKSTNTTSWSVPAGQSVRGEAYDDGSGSMSVLAADGGPEAGTTAGAVTATANSRGSQAIMWTIPLRVSQ